MLSPLRYLAVPAWSLLRWFLPQGLLQQTYDPFKTQFLIDYRGCRYRQVVYAGCAHYPFTRMHHELIRLTQYFVFRLRCKA